VAQRDMENLMAVDDSQLTDMDIIKLLLMFTNAKSIVNAFGSLLSSV
jgi:hypothetical protein